MKFWELNLKEIGVLKTKLWKLESWKLFEDEILKINKIIIIKKCENWNFGNWELNSEIGVLKIIWEVEFWKFNYKLEFWKLIENWSFEN